MKEKEENLPLITLEQVLFGQAPKPFTFLAYHEFLLKKQSEENAEFLVDLVMYRRLAARYFPDPLDGAEKTEFLITPEAKLPTFTIPADMSTDEFEKKIAGVKMRLVSLTEKYLKPDAPREVNLPSKISKPLLTLIEREIYHPDILNEAFVHIEEMLQHNGFDKFLKEATEICELELDKKIKRLNSFDSTSDASLEDHHYPQSRKPSRDNEKRHGFLQLPESSARRPSAGTLTPIAAGRTFSTRRNRSPSVGENTPQPIQTAQIPALQSPSTLLSPVLQSPSAEGPQSSAFKIRSPSADSITADKVTSPKPLILFKQKLINATDKATGAELTMVLRRKSSVETTPPVVIPEDEPSSPLVDGTAIKNDKLSAPETEILDQDTQPILDSGIEFKVDPATPSLPRTGQPTAELVMEKSLSLEFEHKMDHEVSNPASKSLNNLLEMSKLGNCTTKI